MGDIIGLVTARGGSRRLPGKNIKTMAGKPMMAWTIDAAQESEVCKRIIVTTEDKKIEHVAKVWGAEVLKRPKELATHDASSFDVICHAIEKLGLARCDYVLLLQPTSPLRTAADIKEAVRIMQLYKSDAVVSSTGLELKPNGAIYLNRVSSLLDSRTFYPDGKTTWYSMPAERSIDVDELWQFDVAECLLMKRRKK